MTGFDDPSARFEIWMTRFRPGLLTPGAYVRNIPFADHRMMRRITRISGIGAQIEEHRTVLFRRKYPGSQYGINLSNIVPIRPGDDDRQRDATLVDQQMAFGAIFFPYPSGSVRRFPWPKELSSWSRQCFATPRRFPPSRRTRQVPASTTQEKSPLAPMCGNKRAPNWHSQIALLVTLSIGCRFSEHTQSPRIHDAVSLVCGQHRVSDNRSYSYLVEVWESKAQLSSRTHRILPKNKPFSLTMRTSSVCGIQLKPNITEKVF